MLTENRELTAREREVAKMLAVGRTNAEIGEALAIAVKTVDTHRGHVLKKLGLRNNAELVHWALRTKMVELIGRAA